MVNIGIIILNYIAYQETLNCVLDFKKQSQTKESIKIIIVDNCSPNNSFAILSEKFNGDEQVCVLQTEQNLGFAGGNNRGYKKLLEYMQPDFVIFANEDIIIKENNLFTWIHDCFNKYNFAVLGPSIVTRDEQIYQSPLMDYSTNKYKCLWRIGCLYLRIGILKLEKTLKISPVKLKQPSQNYVKNNMVDVTKPLQGAFHIFSQNYFQKYAEPYHPDTFLYMEENLLKLRCERYNLVSVYDPGFEIIHLCEVSTHATATSPWAVKLFKLQNYINSTKIFMKELAKY